MTTGTVMWIQQKQRRWQSLKFRSIGSLPTHEQSYTLLDKVICSRVDSLCCHEASVRSLDYLKRRVQSVHAAERIHPSFRPQSALDDSRAASSRLMIRIWAPSGPACFLAKGLATTYSMSLPNFFVLVLGFASIFVTGANAQSQGQPTGILFNPLQAHSLDGLSATRDRPLFSPDRRPPAPPPPPVERAPEPPPAPPDVTLLGIVVDGERARAIVRSGTAKIERVQIGDDIGGWKVSQIGERRLLLSLDDRSAMFTLFSRKAEDKPRDQPQQHGTLQTASSAVEAPRPASRRRK
jgi:hypothetical protein